MKIEPLFKTFCVFNIIAAALLAYMSFVIHGPVHIGGWLCAMGGWLVALTRNPVP